MASSAKAPLFQKFFRQSGQDRRVRLVEADPIFPVRRLLFLLFAGLVVVDDQQKFDVGIGRLLVIGVVGGER